MCESGSLPEEGGEGTEYQVGSRFALHPIALQCRRHSFINGGDDVLAYHTSGVRLWCPMKKARTNVSVDAALLSEARALGINLSATLEDRLRDLVKQAREARWLAENGAALADANEFLKRHGLWSDGLRQF